MESLHGTFSFDLIDSNKGYGIKSLKKISIEERGLSETPIFSYVHHYSKHSYLRKLTLLCDNCFRNIGSLVENLNHVLKIDKKQVNSKLETLLNDISKDSREPSSIPILKCENGCGLIFCSDKCLKDYDRIHLMLCKHMNQDEKLEWEQFKRYALKTHENFYFAGILNQSQSLEGLIYLRILYESNFGGEITSCVDMLDEFYSVSWEQITNTKDPILRADVSFELLEKCLARFVEGINDHYINETFNKSYYLKMLGMMDLVCVNIEFENPLNDLILRAWDSLKEESHKALLIKDLMEVYNIINFGNITEDDENVDEERIIKIIQSKNLFPDVVGLGVFEFLSKMNHSCSPNLEVEFQRNNTAIITPLRNINEGEEVVISYINEKEGLDDRRRKLLENYGFECNCAKCTLERKNKSIV